MLGLHFLFFLAVVFLGSAVIGITLILMIEYTVSHNETGLRIYAYVYVLIDKNGNHAGTLILLNGLLTIILERGG